MPQPHITRPPSDEFNAFYQGYIDHVGEGDLLVLLEAQSAELRARFDGLDEARALHRYAPGKWSVKEVLGHLIDTERIMACRALRIARGDTTPIPGFDENDYVANAGFDARPLAEMLAEYVHLRASTLALFRGFADADFLRIGTANGQPVSVRALAHIIAGHENHHLTILRDRYGVSG